MKSSVRMIATAAFSAFLMSTFFAGAYAAAQPSAAARDDKTAASGDDPAAPVLLLGAPVSASGGMNFGPPKVELFLGYSYLRAMPSLTAGNRLVWLNGGSASIAFNLNRYLGIVGDFGGFNDTELNLTGVAPSHVVDSSGTVFTYLFGPRLSFRSHERITPFVQALFGGMHASEVTLSHCTGDACTLLPSENTFAMTAGGGLDIKVRRHFAIRLIQAEYLMTRFNSLTTGSTTMQNDMRLSSGIVFRFGGAPPRPAPLPVSYSCSVTPSFGYPGDRFAVSGTALNLDPSETASYTWTTSGGAVSAGTPGTATIDATNVPPGTYALEGHVAEGDKPGESADCTAPFVVKAFEALTVSCSANPSTVAPGDSSTITAIGVSPQSRPLTYTFTSTGGSVSGTGSTAVLSTTGAAPGTITVSCNVADDKGQTATATTPVTVAAPATAPPPATSELCTVHFERDSRRPSRVDNEGKACLDDIALTLQRSSDAKLALVGIASSSEKGGAKLAAERAANTKAYLVSEKGIDSSRIAVYTSSQDGKTVSTTLIPAGATFDTTGDTPVE